MLNNTTPGRNIKTNIIFPLTLFVLAASVRVAAAQAAAPRLDSNVVWTPSPHFSLVMDERCGRIGSARSRQCFLILMKELGASSEAVRFSALIDTTGFARKFVNTGVVDIVFVSYPFRANENYGITLVNGRPGMIDVDDFQFVDLTELKKDSMYMRTLGSFPDASLWPGDRFNFEQPECESLPGGGQRFVVSYTIRNGCCACERIGTARFAFDFAADGKFEGTRLIRVMSPVR